MNLDSKISLRIQVLSETIEVLKEIPKSQKQSKLKNLDKAWKLIQSYPKPQDVFELKLVDRFFSMGRGKFEFGLIGDIPLNIAVKQTSRYFHKAIEQIEK